MDPSGREMPSYTYIRSDLAMLLFHDCSDDGEEVVCIGSVAELEALSGAKVTDLHRHFIDHLTIPSRQGKGVLRRVEVRGTFGGASSSVRVDVDIRSLGMTPAGSHSFKASHRTCCTRKQI